MLKDEHVVALLTERDIVAFQSRLGLEGKRDDLRVKDAMHADQRERLRFLPPEAPYDEVMSHLQRAPLQALIVTEGGKSKTAVLGIITVSDLLPKL